MKKILPAICIILTLVLASSFVSCAKKQKNEPENSTTGKPAQPAVTTTVKTDDVDPKAGTEDTCTEIQIVTIDPGEIIVVDKPVIYLYPEEETKCSVYVGLDGKLTCAYPDYKDGWKGFTALPDGTLIFEDGSEYYCLYWEGATEASFEITEGYCVAGSDTAGFLADILPRLGLTAREANEFIIYWLPLMQNNEYNLISFDTEAYTEAAKLDIDPAPDTLIRVFMTWKAVDEKVEISAPEIITPERSGFTVVEWGGSKIG